MARPRTTLDTKQHPLVYPRCACPYRLYDGQERVAREGEDRVGVVEDVGSLIRRQPVIGTGTALTVRTAAPARSTSAEFGAYTIA